MTIKAAREESWRRRWATAWIASMTLLPITGCVPAWQVQRTPPPRACEVNVCVLSAGGAERCACHTHERARAVLRDAIGEARTL